MFMLDTQAIDIKRHSVSQMMLLVMIALLPGSVLYSVLVSPVIILNIVLAMLFALLLEAIVMLSRKRSVKHALSDGSVVLAAWLFALSVPPMLPIWQLFIGVTAMVLMAKHLFGGLGQNPFNPAMAGYAVLLISFPQNMTLWPDPVVLGEFSLANLISAKIFPAAILPIGTTLPWDAISMATPLDVVHTARQTNDLEAALYSVQTNSGSSPWVWMNFGFLFGGIFLLIKGVIRWYIPVSFITALTFLLIIQAYVGTAPQLSVHIELLSGATMLGAFFIATDPVTAASSKRGKLVYGAGIGALVYVIRQFGGYPDGIAFAVLLMNLTVPLIDHLSGNHSKHR